MGPNQFCCSICWAVTDIVAVTRDLEKVCDVCAENHCTVNEELEMIYKSSPSKVIDLKKEGVFYPSSEWNSEDRMGWVIDGTWKPRREEDWRELDIEELQEAEWDKDGTPLFPESMLVVECDQKTLDPQSKDVSWVDFYIT